MLGLYLSGGFLGFLQDLLGSIFELWLEPQLIIVFDFVLGFIIPVIRGLLSGILYSILATCLGMVDFLEQAFNILSGVSTVTYISRGVVEGIVVEQPKQVYLTSFLLEHDAVSKVLIYFTVFSVALSFLFAIYAVLKSVNNSVVNEREFRPVGKILRSWGRGAINFLVTPLLVVVGIKISTIVLIQVSNAIVGSQGGYNTTLGSVIFLANSLGASKTKQTNKRYSVEGQKAAKAIYGEKEIPSTDAFIRDPSIYDSLRVDYYIGSKDYKNVKQVQGDFDLAKYNFTTAFVCAIFVFLVLATSLLSFIRVIIEVLILYVAAPFTIALFPMDDGRMFDEWKGTFFTRMVINYGMVFSMKLFLTLVPTIMSPKLKLIYPMTENQTFGYFGIFDGLMAGKMSQGWGNMQGVIDRVGISQLDYLMKALLILGGAYSVLQAQHLILEIVSEPVAAGIKGTTASGVDFIKRGFKALGGKAVQKFKESNGSQDQQQEQESQQNEEEEKFQPPPQYRGKDGRPVGKG